MKKSLILLALLAYAGAAVYSLTQMKHPGLSAVNAQASASEASSAVTFKLVTNQQEVLMKFYREAFGTDWQAVTGGYQGQVLDAVVLISETRTKKRLRRMTLQLRTDDLESHADDILKADGALRTQGKSYVVNDPDGNVIVLTKPAQ